MKLARPTDRPQPETIIPLIDVVFFLLVFFMLIGRMDATAPFEVLPPQAQAGSDMPAGGITLSVGKDGALAVDGLAQPDGLASTLARLAETPEVLVRINAHQAAPLRHVLPLVTQLREAGAENVALIVTPSPP